MNMTNILIPIATGFEEIEAITLIDLLRRAEFEVTTVSINASLIVEGAHGIKIEADAMLNQVEDKSFSAVILPGGMPGTLNLKKDEALKAAVLNWVDQGSAYGAICAAPTALAAWGLLQGKQSTSYPGFENEMGDANYSTQSVVVDGNCLTSRGVGTAIDYACAWVSYFKDDDAAQVLKKKILAE